jgi:hypothetical protein
MKQAPCAESVNLEVWDRNSGNTILEYVKLTLNTSTLRGEAVLMQHW